LVAPGAIETDMNLDLEYNKNKLENVLRRIPVGRVGPSEGVENVVEFLASPKARYVNGATFFVDGGRTL
jgi:glucose 1-dehydrogenase